MLVNLHNDPTRDAVRRVTVLSIHRYFVNPDLSMVLSHSVMLGFNSNLFKIWALPSDSPSIPRTFTNSSPKPVLTAALTQAQATSNINAKLFDSYPKCKPSEIAAYFNQTPTQAKLTITYRYRFRHPYH